MSYIRQISNRFNRFGERSRKSILNIFLSFGAKGITIIIQLMIVPLTINYVNPTQYGIWLSLSSIISWIGFFDLGLGNGMRNKFAESIAKNEKELAHQYVSTTYFTIGGIVLCLFLIISLLNQFVSWATVLNVDQAYTLELRKVFGVLSVFFCLNMVVKLFSTLLTADQRPGIASIINVVGQALSLFAIYILTKVSDGSLLNLALFYSGIPTVSLLCWSLVAFSFTRYRQYAPHYKSFRPSLIKNILNIGIQFFVIYLCIIAIFQIINVAISRELGPEAVTQYNIAYKYFNIVYSIMVIVITPFWSAFTDAYYKNDIKWMMRVKTILERFWLLSVLVVIFMVIIADLFYKLWIGNEVHIDKFLSVGLAVYILVQCYSAIYMNMINGIGAVRLQLIVYLVFAFVSYPVMIYSCRYFGLLGILISPTLCYLVQSILAKIQLEKLLRGNSQGIWAR